jgi:hypothetical protein
MLTAVALPRSALPLRQIERHGLDALAHDRGGEKELQFHLTASVPVLPVRHEGQLCIVRRGCRRGESRLLPAGGWTRLARIESGCWPQCGAEAVEVPAALGYDGGVWYAVRQGVQGLLVGAGRGAGRFYLVCEPASHHYRVMTRSDWMPVLIGQRI